MACEIITFGCRLNIYESELIKNYINSLATSEDIIVFNSCAVTSEAERQLAQAIRKAHRQRPESKIVITGCAAQINPTKYSSMVQVYKVLGNDMKLDKSAYDRLFSELSSEKALVNDIMSVKETAGHMVEGFENKVRGFLQIQNGCDHRCTFCIIPYGRGNSRSVPVGEIVNQARCLVQNGYKELVLTGVDITAYGKDLLGQLTLGQMIHRLLAQVPELSRLRLSSIDVAEVDADLLRVIVEEERLMPSLHLSLQAGDDMVLKRMKRRHSRNDIINFYYKVSNLRPELTFGADIIAGFPTETEEMFKNTYDLLEELSIIFLHVFPYSERKGTPAACMPQVDKKIRKERAAMLRALGQQKLQQHYANQVGRVLNVLIEQAAVGRTEDFCHITLVNTQPQAVGEVLRAQVEGVSENGQLFGTVLI